MAQVVQLFSNPHAGTYSRRRVQALVRALQERGASVVQSFSADAPPEILDGVDHVCVAGGDGTVRHVASAVLKCGRPVTMSIYPVGTVNLLAKERLYPACAEAFAALVMGDASRPHFPVAAGDDFFFACASVGPDSFAMAQYSPRLKRMVGRLAYGVAFLGLLWRWPRQRIRLHANGDKVDCEAFYVAKGRYYAGPWSLAPGCRVDDPLMHVIALKQARRRDFARLAIALFLGRGMKSVPGAVCFTTTHLAAESDSALPLQADGDVMTALPVRFRVGNTPLSFR
ncbi:diacylglycerol/lipid kinase family protein [Sphingobium sp.]|uniref:diacylglycerol/lipid kinase family protein n=1 Tax=Sphingobium sp. TaxID=1912891 RepID=UPI002ED22AE7